MNLFIFTYQFPYGKQETFLENELLVLAKSFDKIFLVPTNLGIDKTDYRNVPLNVEVLDIDKKYIGNNKKFRSFTSLFFYSIKKEKTFRRKLLYFFHIINFNKYYKKSVYIAKSIVQIVLPKTKPKDIFYTYWFLEGLLPLCLIKDKMKIENKIFSRCHGYDLYDEIQGGVMPFRSFKFDNIEKLLPISIHGYNYLKERLYDFEKIEFSNLGTFNDNNYLEQDRNDGLIIVSCSNLIPIKRVDLILKALFKTKEKVKWIHFGDGILMNDIKDQIKKPPKNVIIELKGRTSNTEIHEFYKTTRVDLFINTSLSEGIPVSIMEAISYGVPVFATDVGGNSEIVSDITGKLVDVDFSVLELEIFINNFKESIYIKDLYRKKVYDFWLDNFNAEKNYKNFEKILKGCI